MHPSLSTQKTLAYFYTLIGHTTNHPLDPFVFTPQYHHVSVTFWMTLHNMRQYTIPALIKSPFILKIQQTAINFKLISFILWCKTIAHLPIPIINQQDTFYQDNITAKINELSFHFAHNNQAEATQSINKQHYTKLLQKYNNKQFHMTHSSQLSTGPNHPRKYYSQHWTFC